MNLHLHGASGSQGFSCDSPSVCLCTSPSIASSWASPNFPCCLQRACVCAKQHLGWERLHGAAGGFTFEACSFRSCAAAPWMPGSSRCLSCWPGWVLREKLSTKLLAGFSKIHNMVEYINNLFLHECSL